MELRQLATGILTSGDLDVKLAFPREPLSDEEPGEPLRMHGPARPPGLEIVPYSQAKVPALEGLQDPSQRPRIVHALANHELQAAELFAWAILAFPRAPREFRFGLARILEDEQRHTRMYIAKLQQLGAHFGDFPVSGYFWNKVDAIHEPIHFVCAMGLTFENANLDFTLEYAEEAARVGDPTLGGLLSQVHRDEIEHVRFGWTWLEHFKSPDETMWSAYTASVEWPLRPELARGWKFHEKPRREVGMDDEFIEMLEQTHDRPRPLRRSRKHPSP